MRPRKLAILIPYRTREAHLKELVPALIRYLAERHPQVSASFHIIEQAGDGPFNRGKLLNVGFAEARKEADYFCCHDVDYVPVEADYSPSMRPARLIWQGLSLAENPETFFGGVTLLNKADLLAANGYSNGYWGWGFEDMELHDRLLLTGRRILKRDGVFRPLGHAHNGITPEGGLTHAAERNRARYAERRAELQRLYREDGISDLRYTRLALADKAGEGWANTWHHLVDLKEEESRS